MHVTAPNVTSRANVEDELVRDHLRIVHFEVADMARRVPRHVNRDDLVSAGMAALAQAARAFDPTRGIRFDRYAQRRIRGALLDELRSRDWASRSVRTTARKVTTATDALTARLGRQPTRDEIADTAGIDASTIDSVAGDVHRATVLNYESLLADGEIEELLPSAAPDPEDVLLYRERCEYLVDAVASLPHRLRFFVVSYFFEGRSMQDIADDLGVTESRVSQLRAQAIGLLRHGMKSQLDPDAMANEPGAGRIMEQRRDAFRSAVAERAARRRRPKAEVA